MEQHSKIRVAIADDHKAVREALAFAINNIGNLFTIDIEAENGVELINKIELAKELPHICILDINMPKMSGYEVLPILKKKWPDIKVVILSMHKEDFAIRSMLNNGASGFLSKGSDVYEIGQALLSIYYNGYYHSDIAPENLFIKINNNSITLPKLTKREIEILRLLCSSLSYKQIAETLNIAYRTVEGHRDKLFEKLNVSSREALMIFAIKNGLCDFLPSN